MARPPRSRLNPGRLAAARALLDLERGGQLAEALAAHPVGDPADRALAWNLALGVLRHRPELDAALVTVTRRGTRTLDAGVLAALRIGAYELRIARVPAHAAVDQAVELSRGLGVGHASGLVNAALRRVGDVEVPAAARLGLPDWLLARWRPRYEAALPALQEPPPRWLVAPVDRAGALRALLHQGVVAVPGPGDSLRVGHEGPLSELPGHAEGRLWPLDPGLVRVAEGLCGSVEVRGAPGLAWLLAARGLAVRPGGEPARVARTREGAAARGLALTADEGPVDRVVVVLLGSGLGALRRLPELRWRRRPEDLAPAPLVDALTDAARVLRPGGALLYVVHSLEPEEGAGVVTRLGGRATPLLPPGPPEAGGDWLQAYHVEGLA